MSEKPEALRLVDEYAQEVKDFGYVESSYVRAKLENHLACLHAEVEALRADAGRYRWLRDHPSWSVSYRIRPGKSKEWRMRDEEGDLWGNWWPTHEQAVDHWIKEQTK